MVRTFLKINCRKEYFHSVFSRETKWAQIVDSLTPVELFEPSKIVKTCKIKTHFGRNCIASVELWPRLLQLSDNRGHLGFFIL
jgi:hypothetical protein